PDGNKQIAFDHQRLAAALNEAAHTDVKPLDLPLMRAQMVDHRTALEFSAEQKRWRCNLNSYHCEMVHRRDEDDEEDSDGTSASSPNSLEKSKPSPDKKWEAIVDNYNVVVRTPDHKQTVTLSTDGSEGNYYTFNSVVWSPDSKYLVAYRIKPGYKRM